MHPLIEFRCRRWLSRLHRARVLLATRGWRGLLGRLAANAPETTTASPRSAQATASPGPSAAGAVRVLVIDGALPRPDRDSGSLRLLGILRLLRQLGMEVDFLAEDGAVDSPDAEALRAIGVRVLPPQLAASPHGLPAIGHAAVVVSRYHLAAYWFPLLRRLAPGTRRILDTVDLHFVREGREAELHGNRALARAARATRRIELAQVAAADVTWVVSEREQQLLAQALPQARVDIVSNLHRVQAPVCGFEAREGLLFVGGGRHPPNADAVRWLVGGILPALPGGHAGSLLPIHLVGADLQAALADLPLPPQVRLHGHVPDLAPLLAQCRVGLAPLRFGAGVKGKVNQYMAHGLPTVATHCAAEAMHLIDGHDVLLADDAAGFAAAIARLHADAALWEQVSHNGLENVRRHFSEDAMLPALRRTFAGLAESAAEAPQSPPA